jgi:hypothetical protein
MSSPRDTVEKALRIARSLASSEKESDRNQAQAAINRAEAIIAKHGLKRTDFQFPGDKPKAGADQGYAETRHRARPNPSGFWGGGSFNFEDLERMFEELNRRTGGRYEYAERERHNRGEREGAAYGFDTSARGDDAYARAAAFEHLVRMHFPSSAKFRRDHEASATIIIDDGETFVMTDEVAKEIERGGGGEMERWLYRQRNDMRILRNSMTRSEFAMLQRIRSHFPTEDIYRIHHNYRWRIFRADVNLAVQIDDRELHGGGSSHIGQYLDDLARHFRKKCKAAADGKWRDEAIKAQQRRQAEASRSGVPPILKEIFPTGAFTYNENIREWRIVVGPRFYEISDRELREVGDDREALARRFMAADAEFEKRERAKARDRREYYYDFDYELRPRRPKVDRAEAVAREKLRKKTEEAVAAAAKAYQGKTASHAIEDDPEGPPYTVNCRCTIKPNDGSTASQAETAQKIHEEQMDRFRKDIEKRLADTILSGFTMPPDPDLPPVKTEKKP